MDRKRVPQSDGRRIKELMKEEEVLQTEDRLKVVR